MNYATVRNQTVCIQTSRLTVQQTMHRVRDWRPGTLAPCQNAISDATGELNWDPNDYLTKADAVRKPAQKHETKTVNAGKLTQQPVPYPDSDDRTKKVVVESFLKEY